jgi:hypothetical protein
VTDQEEGGRHIGIAQQLSQFVRDLRGSARQLDSVTPPRAVPVVEHGRRQRGGSLLDVEIVQTHRAGSV